MWPFVYKYKMFKEDKKKRSNGLRKLNVYLRMQWIRYRHLQSTNDLMLIQNPSR